MSGSPLVKSFLVAVLLMVMAYVTAMLTGDDAQYKPSEGASEVAKDLAPCRVSVLFSHQPSEFSVSHLGEEVFSTQVVEDSQCEFDLNLPIAELTEGIDLVLAPKWGIDTQNTAVAVTLEPEGLEAREHTAWFSGGAPAVLTFTWPSSDE